MSRWFRHYAGMMRDEKLVRVALRSGQPIERVVWVWGAILESAAEINDGGRFDLEEAEIAYFLRTDQADIVSIRHGLEAMGRIRADIVVKWSDRQFQSDKSAERQRRYREKQGRDALPVIPAHGEGVTSRDAQPTVTLRHGDAPETETELDTEKKEDRPKRVRTLCSDDFEEFWKRYPKTPNMSKSEAWKAWQRLSDEDRIAATAAVPKYIGFLRSKTDHPTVHACRFLSQRRFEGFNEPEPDNVVPIGFYAEFGSAELDAWDAHNRKTNGATLPRDKRGGWLVPARYPPGYEPQAATA
jgi:hypothetical protein